VDKVYCSNCKYLLEHWLPGKPEAYDVMDCRALLNIRYDDDWYERVIVSKKDPSEINKDNDCEWFEPKGDTFSKDNIVSAIEQKLRNIDLEIRMRNRE